jgi:uncharacterized protein
MVHLLDVNVLMALAWPNHVHHAVAHRWFSRHARHGWATCPLTQLALVRLSSNPKIVDQAVSPMEALNLLGSMVELPGHEFWPDDLHLQRSIQEHALVLGGHRQCTDAYLLALALHHNGRLATLDKGIFALARTGSTAHRAIALVEEA